MSARLTAVSVRPGVADIIAHVPPSGDAAGFRARVARATRDDGSGRWTAYLFARAHALGMPLPKDAPIAASVQSERNLNGKHTLSGLVRKLADRDEWWTT